MKERSENGTGPGISKKLIRNEPVDGELSSSAGSDDTLGQSQISARRVRGWDVHDDMRSLAFLLIE